MSAIETEALRMRYGARAVVDGIDLLVPEGTVHALLGPNGSGKTTTVRMLATLLRPSGGRARVLGHDTVTAARAVRQRIGLVGQFHAVDPMSTGRQNLVMFARLNGLAAPAARRRADDLLARFDLADAGDRLVRTYSGGMRRRLDILAGTVVRPEVLFLDEPTTGLDPHSRDDIHRYLAEAVAAGSTVLLTTQYLDEAERLADAVTILDAGRIVATGSPAEIVRTVGVRLEVAVPDDQRPAAAEVMAALGGTPVPQLDATWLFDAAAPALPTVVRALDAAGIEVRDIGRRTGTLDDAFLALTARRAA
ncbi:ATP-binding cassette domain-containing protein [Nocardia sp. NPDC057227]|uniref:ATP-binding cassette domain-containing protein n=1 Tax=Nocardia sp. NPDC057227 TaxID=3346056 RepID=UPI0036254018